MTLATALAERLTKLAANPAAPDLAISQWRLVVDTGTATEVGLKDNRPGGPYDAPNTVTATRGDAYVVWGDGKVSTGIIDRTTLGALEEDLRLWRDSAFDDPFAADVLGPQAIPDVPLWDAAASDLAERDQAPLFAALDRFRRELPTFEVERVSGSVSASTAYRHLITSAGLDHQSRSTSVGAFVDADHRAYDYLSLRRPPSDDEITTLIRRAGETNQLLKRDATFTPGRQIVVFWPSAAESLISKFLIANLDGQRVVSGGSAFALAQFEANEALFAPGFSFGIEPTRPLSPGSYQATREGLPARATQYVRDGKLLTPLLDLKHARKAGMAATPVPRGTSSFWLPDPTTDLDSLIAGIDQGMLVYQLLGLHTQDSVRANFSLTVSQGLVIQGGKLVGRAKAIVAGNFLDALREGLTLASVSGKESRAMAFQADLLPG